MVPMESDLPLPTLLSSVLVAFTVEFDNEAEHRMPHRTTTGGPARGADGTWLVSQVMWSNVMQYVDDDGVGLQDLHARARTTRDSLAGLERWGYLEVQSPRPGGRSPAGADATVHPTAAGRRSREVWRPLAGVVEGRWEERFGVPAVESLRSALQAVVDRTGLDPPDYLPIVYPTRNGKAEVPPPLPPGAPRSGPTASRTDLSVLLSHVLLAFTVDFERASRISLPISADLLRVLDPVGVPTRDLPVLTGVSKEAVAMGVGFLVRHGCALWEPVPGAARGKVVSLTPKGEAARAKYRRILDATEQAWEERFGRSEMASLRGALGRLVGEAPTADRSPLFEGLVPYPDGWRARVRRPVTLPHYPMVLHRGGYPDGS
jgi:DNA-binding MarR family transcriptional regulator